MNQIEVTGEGTVSAPPNQSMVTLGAITENPTLSTAQSENNTIVTNIIDSLTKLNIPKDHIQTVDYRIDMQYTFDEGKQHFKGYQVTHLLQVTIEPIEKTGLVVDTAVNHGANSISNIRFINTHPEIYYNHALTLAIQNAQTKASTIANTLQVKLSPYPFNVQEETRSQTPIPYSAAQFTESKTAPIQSGALQVTAAIRAKFTYSSPTGKLDGFA